MVGSTGFPCQDWCCRVALEVTSESTGWNHRYQAACILNVATERSLVIVDELGKDAKCQTVLPNVWPFKISKWKNVNIFCSTYHDGIWGFTERTCAWLAAIRLLGTRTLGDCRKLQVKDSHSPRYLERFQKLDLTTFGTYALRSWNFNGRWLWNRLGHCKTFGWGLEQAQFQKIYFACAFCGFVAT